MPFVVESRRKSAATLEKRWPGSPVLDLTSKGPEPWVRFSPFFPHGGIPIPGMPEQVAQSVEGLWQGLKTFERDGVDPSKWAITTMAGIKRSGKSRGAVLGHRLGDALLGYREARVRIYLPAYQWMLDHRVTDLLDQLRELGRERTVVLLDYETNGDLDDLSHPLSHAALVKHRLDGTWPAES